jgi:cell division protease FtsH
VFNEFGERTPSDKPPIKTPGELAIERGEPWPPPAPKPLLQPAPTPVTTVPGGGDLPGGPPYATPEPNANPYAPPANGGRPNGTGQWPQAYGGQQPSGPAGGYQGGPSTGGYGGPPNYGAPPGWTPATSPTTPGQPWRPAGDRAPDEHGWFAGPADGQQDQGPTDGQQHRDADGQDDQQQK